MNKYTVFRLATLTDLDSIDNIYNQAINMKMATADTKPFSHEERLIWFRAHSPEKHPIYVIEKEENVVAYFSLSAYRPRREALKYVAEISYFIDENYRKQGIGSELLRLGIERAKDFGYKNLIAILLGNNKASIRLLRKFGFEQWGLLPNIAEFDENSIDHLYYGLKMYD